MVENEDTLNSFLKESNARSYNPINRLTVSSEGDPQFNPYRDTLSALDKDIMSKLSNPMVDLSSVVSKYVYGDFESEPPHNMSKATLAILSNLEDVERAFRVESHKLDYLINQLKRLHTLDIEKALPPPVRTNFEALSLASVDTFVDIVFDIIRTRCTGEASPREAFKEFLNAPYEKDLFH